MSQRLSRRDLFKVAGASSAAMTVAALAQAGTVPSQWAAPKCTGWSWEKPMTPIEDNEIEKVLESDVVVIGASLAGLAAAISAKEEGASVTLIEKTGSWGARGGHITAFGSKVQKSLGVSCDWAKLFAV